MSGSHQRSEASEGNVCRGCDTPVPLVARFCSNCGLPVDAAGNDPVAFVGDDRGVGSASRRQGHGAVETDGRVRRDGSPRWLAVVGGACVVAMAWLLFRAPPVDDGAAVDDSADTEMVDDPSLDSNRDAGDEVDDAVDWPVDGNASTNVTPTPGEGGGPQPEGTDSDTRGEGAAVEDSRDPVAVERSAARPITPVDLGPAAVDDLDAEGWTLLVGDGHHVETIDLGDGTLRRYDDVGAPVAMLGDRLLLYQPPELLSVPLDDLNGEADLLARVPTLQEMYTRARSVKSPVLTDDGRAIWWPNNNSNPQTWIKVDLSSGDVLDEMSLPAVVFGGPEVVSTLGSGTFERIDGRWEPLGDLFASSASPRHVLGQRCTSPNSCRWILVDRRSGSSESLAIDVDGPFDATLISAADRPMILLSDRIVDLDADRSISLVLANPLEVVATNRSNMLAVAHGVPSGVTRSSVTVHNLDEETQARVELSALSPDWLLLDRR